MPNIDLPLHIAVRDNNIDIAKMLLESQCDVHAVNAEGLTPLQLATQSDNAEMVVLLLQHGAGQQTAPPPIPNQSISETPRPKKKKERKEERKKVIESIPSEIPRPQMVAASAPAVPTTPFVPRNIVKAWGGGMMTFLCIISFFVPIVGWIMGGINLKHPARNGQAIALIAIGTFGFFFYLGTGG